MPGGALLLAAWLAGAFQIAQVVPRHAVPPKRPPAVEAAPQPDEDTDEDDDEDEDDEEDDGATIARPSST